MDQLGLDLTQAEPDPSPYKTRCTARKHVVERDNRPGNYCDCGKTRISVTAAGNAFILVIEHGYTAV